MSMINVDAIFISQENSLILLLLNISIISICYFVSELPGKFVIQFMGEDNTEELHYIFLKD